MRFDLLDHGYLELIDSMGTDASIIEAARMSTDKGFLGWGPVACPLCVENGDPPEDCEDKKPGDEKLLRYLYENKHSTPFEFAELVIEVQAPIFVFREWHRHRTQSYNEMSARYTPLPDLNYIPSVERMLMNSKKNKQAASAKGAAVLTEDKAEAFRLRLQHEYSQQEAFYRDALGAGVPKELARCVLPVARYSKMRAKTCLRNWLAFLTLRMAPQAQWEIRQYANAVGEEIIARKWPRTWELFKENRDA